MLKASTIQAQRISGVLATSGMFQSRTNRSAWFNLAFSWRSEPEARGAIVHERIQIIRLIDSRQATAGARIAEPCRRTGAIFQPSEALCVLTSPVTAEYLRISGVTDTPCSTIELATATSVKSASTRP